MSNSSGLEVFEERLSYAQVWEDPRVLQSALQVGPEDDVLSICSAGDNAFALGIAGAKSVTCIDLSRPQLALAQLKLAGAKHLTVDEQRILLGFGDGRPEAVYLQLQDHLPAAVRKWWDAHGALIADGIVHGGRFEGYLAKFRRFLLPMVHGSKRVDALLSNDVSQQRAFFDQHWNTRRWRSMFRMFFSQRVMARSGRSDTHFRYVEGPVADVFLKRTEHVLADLPLHDNFFVQWMLKGCFADLDHAHPYLSSQGHRELGNRCDGFSFVQEDLESFLSRCPPNSFSAFNYSNLFEYLSPEQHIRILELTVQAARPGARIAYWNLLVPRLFPAKLSDRLAPHRDRAAALLQADRAFVYGGFQLDTVK